MTMLVRAAYCVLFLPTQVCLYETAVVQRYLDTVETM
jgi:hypothetical protein